MRYLMLIFLTAMCLSTQSCSSFNAKLGVEDDWIGEEIMEGVIDHYTGFDIDLTP